MASLVVSENFVAVSSILNSLIVVKSCKEPKLLTLQLPQHSDVKRKNNCDSECNGVISNISTSGSYFVVCSGKKLTIWDTSTWLILSNREIVRAASSIKFTPKESHVVVADKSGDVYLFSLLNQEPGKLILGHLSVILDVLISTDEKFIITCDRDEKIRVSNFPNAYNIHCFCLGHKEFVSDIKFVPHDENLIISASGDSTIKCWRYGDGLEIASYVLDSLSCDVLSETNKSTLVANRIVVLKKDEHSSLMCIGIPNIQRLVVVLLDQCKDTFNFKFHTFIDVQYEPVSICSMDTQLWILSNEDNPHMSLFQWCNKEDKFLNQQEIINHIFKDIDLKIIINTAKKQDLLDYLYKKKYDNVQEYLEKKKARIEGAL